MARTRTLTLLRGDVRRRADIESATDRHPDTDLTRYINQGIAELYDLLIDARGAAYYRKSPPVTITTTGGATTRYAFGSGSVATDFYKLISVRFADPGQYRLMAFTSEDEPILRETSLSVQDPTHYQIQPGYLELLPAHASGRTIVVDYVPYATELSADGDTFDGINGWEEYAVDWAAKRCAIKDEEYQLVATLDQDMAMLKQRIQSLAVKRDIGRPERVKDVRGGMAGGFPLRWRW